MNQTQAFNAAAKLLGVPVTKVGVIKNPGALTAIFAELKERARRHLLAYRRATDHLDCGHHMATTISADASHHAREFDAAMDALAAIDPACPARRLCTDTTQRTP